MIKTRQIVQTCLNKRMKKDNTTHAIAITCEVWIQPCSAVSLSFEHWVTITNQPTAMQESVSQLQSIVYMLHRLEMNCLVTWHYILN